MTIPLRLVPMETYRAERANVIEIGQAERSRLIIAGGITTAETLRAIAGPGADQTLATRYGGHAHRHEHADPFEVSGAACLDQPVSAPSWLGRLTG